jgi:hypothetical protein
VRSTCGGVEPEGGPATAWALCGDFGCLSRRRRRVYPEDLLEILSSLSVAFDYPSGLPKDIPEQYFRPKLSRWTRLP